MDRRGRTSLGELARRSILEAEEDLGACFRAVSAVRKWSAVAVRSRAGIGAAHWTVHGPFARLAAAADSGRNSLTCRLLAQPCVGGSGENAEVLEGGSGRLAA